MSKITYEDNFRVVAEVFSLSNADEARCRSDCQEVVDQIKKHIDDVTSVWIESDAIEACEHCETHWENAIDLFGYPWCCEKAQNDFAEAADPIFQRLHERCTDPDELNTYFQLKEDFGQLWDTTAIEQEFTVQGFGGPGVCVAIRKSDGVRGSLLFNHMPRYYYGWSPVEGQ